MPGKLQESAKLLEKWAPVLEHKSMPKIADRQRAVDTAVLLENQAREGQLRAGLLSENAGNNMTGGAGAAGIQAGYDPVLISVIRRAAPLNIAYDVMGVQTMNTPTGLIFAMRSRYGADNQNPVGAEALFDSINSAHSGAAAGGGVTQENSPIKITPGVSPAPDTVGTDSTYGPGTRMTTAAAEILGTSGGGSWGEMSFALEKVAVDVGSRKLRASYSLELAEDMKRLHGLDAEAELSQILSREITSEINREVLGSIYRDAKIGAANTGLPGLFDLEVDSSGRWSVEKFKGLMFQIEREANQIFLDTRRGKGNIVICSPDVASALSMAGLLDVQSAISGKELLNSNLEGGSTYAGILNGRYKVYIDPYLSTAGDKHVVVVGYKGSDRYDAGKFYCPYVQLQKLSGAINPETMQPVIGFQTRYGLVDNPFARAYAPLTDTYSGPNLYYRKFLVSNLLVS
jgi:hypothetical protein